MLRKHFVRIGSQCARTHAQQVTLPMIPSMQSVYSLSLFFLFHLSSLSLTLSGFIFFSLILFLYFILRVNKLLIVSLHSYTFYFCSSEEKRVYLDCTRFNFGFCLQHADAYTIFTRTLYMCVLAYPISVKSNGAQIQRTLRKTEHFQNSNSMSVRYLSFFLSDHRFPFCLVFFFFFCFFRFSSSSLPRFYFLLLLLIFRFLHVNLCLIQFSPNLTRYIYR